jgi:hypothetical protein
MAVLVEAISAITRRDAINAKYPGGWDAFVSAVPNATLCFDDRIARVGFMIPHDVELFIDRLTQSRLTFLADGKAQDIAVADQQRGLTAECEWLEFGRFPFGSEGGKVSACWFFDGPRLAAGVHLSGKSMDLATPPDWSFEGSLSDRFGFVPNGQEDERLEFLRKEDGVDVFLDRETGKEVCVGRNN